MIIIWEGIRFLEISMEPFEIHWEGWYRSQQQEYLLPSAWKVVWKGLLLSHHEIIE